MARFNVKGTRPAVHSSLATEVTASGLTHEGAPGYARDAKSELFLLAVSHLGDGSFYESADRRNDRFTMLLHSVAVSDPQWTAAFIPWLRDSAGMRTASVIAAAEAAKAMLEAGMPGGRQLIARSLKRADEPGELLAYWRSRYGRTLPMPVKRGLADAVAALFDEYSLLKYDTASHGCRFSDVLELAHPRTDPADTWRRDLFKHALDRRHGRDKEVPESLAMIRANRELRKRAAADPSALLDPAALKAAGMTWEDALSLAGGNVGKRELWTALLPSLGYFALIRNLRNVDQAGVPDDVAQAAMARIADPGQVRKSRLFPFRFLAAYNAVPSLRWAYPLEKALDASLASVPVLKGRTLVLVDRSGSMFGGVSDKSGLNRADTAALFGSAIAARAEHADLVQFGTSSQLVLSTDAARAYGHAESLLKMVQRFGEMGGTNTADAVRSWYKGHDRVVIVTDEQAWGGYRGADPVAQVPASVPAYTWNLAGDKYGHGPSGTGNRHALGGLTDHSYKLITMLEAGRDANWDDLFGAQ